MDADRWARVAEIYQIARERAPSERGAYLSSSCGGDDELRREVESLLAQAAKAVVIDAPVWEAAAGVLDDNPAMQRGSRIGPYEVAALIGEGGMGQVYRARDTTLHRDVALKILPVAFTNDSDRLARFRREAQVLAALNHPNIGAIYGFEEVRGEAGDDVRALVLELVEGPTLADHLTRGPLTIDEAVAIARQIAEALEAAHEHGIVHRDLKPANIKVREDGTVKVLDFGLAKAMDLVGTSSTESRPPAATSPTVMSPAVTAMGIILGTAAYMSPEQAKGKPADKRSDVWAFGCVLYEMLAGRRAFEGEDISDTLAAVLRGEPDWTALPADVSSGIRLLLKRCLEKDRKKRIADMSAARFVLEEPAFVASAGGPSITATPTRTWKRASAFLVAALSVVLIVGGIAWTLRGPATPPTITRLTYPLPEGQQFSNPGRRVLAISPDGTQMVYVANQRLYRRSMSELEPQLIPGTQGLAPSTPIFSPDGRSIVFAEMGLHTLKKVGVGGASPATIADLGGAGFFGMSWADNTILLGLGSRGVMRLPANGGPLEQLITVKDDEVADGPQMLPGGRAVLFTLATGTTERRWDNAKIVAQTFESRERKILIDGGADARYLPTGHLLYAREGTLFAIPFDPQRLEVSGGPVRVAEGVRRASGAGSNTGAAQFSVSDTGSLIYVPGPSSNASFRQDLALIDRQGAVQRLKLPARPYEFPRVSPDGQWVAVGTDDGKEAIVWVHDLSGATAMRRLTFEGRNRFPVWSADGQRIAFQSDREGDLGIFWQGADGSGIVERLTKPEQGETHIPISWSHDGRTLLFTVTQGTNFSLWTFSLSSRKAAAFGTVQSGVLPNAVFSPDARWVAYEVRPPDPSINRSAIFVEPFPRTGQRRQIAVGVMPFWSRDGKQLFFAENYTSADLTVASVTTRPVLTFGNLTSLPRGGLASAQGGTNVPRNWDMALDDNRQIGVVDAEETQPQIRVVLNWLDELKRLVPTH